MDQASQLQEGLNQLSQTWTSMLTADPSWTAKTTLRSILTEEEIVEFMAMYGSESDRTAIEMLDSDALHFMEFATKLAGKRPAHERSPERDAVGQAMDMKASRFSFFSLSLLNEEQIDEVGNIYDTHFVENTTK